MDFSQYVKGNALEISNTTIDISELVSFLQNNMYITKLSLESAGIGDKGAEALAKLSNLTKLYLGRNSIGDKGAEALANSNLINLTSLNLYKNSISGSLTEEAVLASLKQKREMIEIPNRIRKMEERHQADMMLLREESQNRLREMEERH